MASPIKPHSDEKGTDHGRMGITTETALQVQDPNMHKLSIWKSDQKTMENQTNEGNQAEDSNSTRAMRVSRPNGIDNTMTCRTTTGKTHNSKIQGSNNLC
jgi:hypothetical protein